MFCAILQVFSDHSDTDVTSIASTRVVFEWVWFQSSVASHLALEWRGRPLRTVQSASFRPWGMPMYSKHGQKSTMKNLLFPNLIKMWNLDLIRIWNFGVTMFCAILEIVFSQSHINMGFAF